MCGALRCSVQEVRLRRNARLRGELCVLCAVCVCARARVFVCVVCRRDCVWVRVEVFLNYWL